MNINSMRQIGREEKNDYCNVNRIEYVVKYKLIVEYLLSGLIKIKIFLKILVKDYEMSYKKGNIKRKMMIDKK